ncbi:hypothetical protein SVAN01_09566 [Stagonosporopsis vannaccii]|nr:hypothetical protein SVAN01_09566 [Stagonosporopsis vannaccii]
MLRSRSEPEGVQLIVYAEPVARRMLHLNNLDYHITTSLPKGSNHYVAFNRTEHLLWTFYLEWQEYNVLFGYLSLRSGLFIDKNATLCSEVPHFLREEFTSDTNTKISSMLQWALSRLANY